MPPARISRTRRRPRSSAVTNCDIGIRHQIGTRDHANVAEPPANNPRR
jgi:hypothetical protein